MAPNRGVGSLSKVRLWAGAHKPLRDNGVHASGCSPARLSRAYLLHPQARAMGTALGWYEEGGPIMWLIALVGVAGVAVLLERFYIIVVRSRTNGRVFIERVIQLVRAGKIDEAIKLCAGSNAALSDMGLVILRSRSRDEPELQQVAAAATFFVRPKLSRRLQYLTVLGSVAIMLGVIGTLMGVRVSLLASGADDGHAGRLSAGLAAAFIPAIFGVAVAAVLCLGRGYLVSQSELITEQLEEFSARLINALIDRPDVRLGHR